MKVQLTIVCLFIVSCLPGQTDSSQINIYPGTYSGISVLTKKDIIRLPASDIMELVKGTFPFISRITGIEEEYSFIVNGFVLVNPNAINISQIERISFFPAGTLLTRGSLNKRGTFVIDTKAEKKEISFSTKTGLLRLDNEKIFGGNGAKTENGLFTLNELSYQNKAKHSYVSSSVSFLKMRFPELSYFTFSGANNTTEQSIDNKRNRIRISNFGRLQFNQKWNIEGGLFYTNQPVYSNEQTQITSGSLRINGTEKNKRLSHYIGAHASLSYSPVKKLKNVLSTEVTYASQEANDLTKTNYSDGSFYSVLSINNDEEYKTYTISDHFSWQVINSDAFKIQPSILARYRHTAVKQKSYFQDSSSMGYSFATANRKINNKSLSLSPSIYVDIKSILSSEIALTYDTYDNLFNGNKTNTKKTFWNGSVKINVASLLHASHLISLDLSAYYNEYLTTYEKSDKLGLDIDFPAPGPVSQFITSGYKPSNSWLYTLGFSAWKNRFSFYTNYRIINSVVRLYSQIWPPGGITLYSLRFEDMQIKSLSFETKTSIIEKENKNWSVYASLFKEKYEIDNYPGSQRADWTFTDSGKDPWWGSLRTSFTIKRFFTQLSTLISFNEAGNDRNGMFSPDVTQYNTNFFLAGYKFPVKTKAIREVEINAQSKNLFQSKSLPAETYIGLGVHVNFR